MDSGSSPKPGSKPPGSDEASLTGTPKHTAAKKPLTTGFKLMPSSKGVENAKKRLRAFSIQKKKPITPVTGQAPKAVTGGSATVIIGKLTAVKTTPKPEENEQKKATKPPKPGVTRKALQESYTVQRRRTLTEIEEMKRKMELVDLGIPLGLIYPTSSSDKAMPTKAMPPIKSFLDQSKLDEIINEAKKAKAEGKNFKFDYNKLLPDYDNPFQRKKEERGDKNKSEENKSEEKDQPTEKIKEFRKFDSYGSERRHSFSYRKDDKVRRDRSNDKNDRRDKKERKDSEKSEKDTKETDVNLNDYLVCDSWSLENEDKTNSSSPQVHEKSKRKDKIIEDVKVTDVTDSPVENPVKIQRLQPVMDSFKFEIDEDEILDMFDENTETKKFTKKIPKRDIYDSPVDMKFLDSDATEKREETEKDSNDAMSLTDDTFLESVINEIKQEAMSDDETHDKGLVEYDSPLKEVEYSPGERVSVTPELNDRMRDLQSSRSDYSDGYRSTESGYKSTESGCRSTESGYKSKETSYKESCYKWESGYKSKGRGYKESMESGHKSTESRQKSRTSYKSLESQSDRYRMSMDKEMESQVQKATMDSLETWSFVMKICQPLLFRHDRNICYKETRAAPKLWYTENPKICSCVKDRSIVYEELEMCKMGLVDRVYGCDQIPDVISPKARTWYPQLSQCLTESSGMLELSTEWEAEDSQPVSVGVVIGRAEEKRRSATPQRSDEIYLDREYQRFMEAVWPEVSEAKSATSRSTTPVKQEARKKKKTEEEKETEDKKKAKKIKLSSEGWSQESDIDEDTEKNKKTKSVEKEKTRKRKHSTSLSDSEGDAKKKKKSLKKKTHKKRKADDTKRRRLKNRLKKLKEKEKKKKKKVITIESDEEDKETKKKLKKKKLQKKKKTLKKKKSKPKSSSSSSSTSSSSTDSSDSEDKRKKKKKKDAKKKRKQSTSESTQSEELFDVNILNNIKTERLTDDEKNQKLDFSPRRKPKGTIKQIINVKELQNDFVGSNILVKQEIVEEASPKIEEVAEDSVSIEKQTTECSSDTVECSSGTVEFSSGTVEFSSGTVECSSETVECSSETVECSRETVEFSNETVECSSEPVKCSSVPEIAVNDVPSKEEIEFKEPQITPQSTPQIRPDDTNHSQSSQDSSLSKEQVPYEKDDSHLRPSSQNSNYSFNDVINASHPYHKEEEEIEELQENYEQGNYEMYEHLAMAYQSDVAKQPASSVGGAEWWGGAGGAGGAGSQRIETLVCARSRAGAGGEIKCDWRAGDQPPLAPPSAPAPSRPSRWGLKPGEVNIVLTGGNNEHFPIQSVVEPVYQIQSIANRSDNNSTGYDEAYEDMYGASDRLQYGDCFAPRGRPTPPSPPHPGAHPAQPNNAVKASSSLDDRIIRVLRDTVLGDVAKEVDETEADKDGDRDKRNTKSGRSTKRVSFADGYKPGQDSDVEEPPLRKRKKSRRLGCAWPCPATHADHVPLWDALPPPPPPADPPPPNYPLPRKLEPGAGAGVSRPSFMPPEPPPGLLSFSLV